MKEVTPTTATAEASLGTAGLASQMGNQPTTVSGYSDIQNDVNNDGFTPGGFIETAIDKELFVHSDGAPLMQVIMKAKKVNVDSPVVEHYAIDEQTSMVTVASIGSGATSEQITLVPSDKLKVHAYDTLSVVGIHGYEYEGGQNVPTNKPLMLMVEKVDSSTAFTVMAINGIKTSANDEYGKLPTVAEEASNVITAGKKLIILSNAMYETQKEVDPDTYIPVPTLLYCQKRGTNIVFSDYYDSQHKRFDFGKDLISEANLRNFQQKGDRTFLLSQPSKIHVKGKSGDSQIAFTTKGLRWQVTRQFEMEEWNYDNIIALSKVFYTGEDAPSCGIMFCGEEVLEKINKLKTGTNENIRIIDTKNDKYGWKVTEIITNFGSIQLKYEPTFKKVGYSNCALLIDDTRLVRYVRRDQSAFSDRVDGEEATREGYIVWDCVGLKGSCHIFVNGNVDDPTPGATNFIPWSSSSAPTADTDTTHPGTCRNAVYCFQNAVTLTSKKSAAATAETIYAESGSMFKAEVTHAIAGSPDVAGFITWTRWYGPAE